MKRLTPWFLLLPAIVVVVLCLLTPVVNTMGMTFATPRGIFTPYTRFFANGFNREVVWRTLEIALLTTAISVALGFLAAYVVANFPRRLKSLLIVAAVFPLLTGTVVRSFAWMVILGRNGIINNTMVSLGIVSEPMPLLYSKMAIVIGMVYLFVPLMILSLVGVLENIEKDLVQAAASLGASPAAAFRQVILPLAVPGLIVGAVLVFTGSFTAFATPQLLGGERQTVLATLLYQKAMVTFDWVGASTIATIMVVMTIAIVLLMSRLARRLNPMAV